MAFDVMMVFNMVTELQRGCGVAPTGQNIIAQGKTEGRHPGYAIPKKIFRPVGAAQNTSTFFCATAFFFFRKISLEKTACHSSS